MVSTPKKTKNHFSETKNTHGSFLDYLSFHELLTQNQVLFIEGEKRRNPGLSLDLFILELNFLSEEEWVSHLALYSGVPLIFSLKETWDPTLKERVPLSFCKKEKLVPYRKTGEGLEVAMVDPYQWEALERVRSFFPQVRTLIPRLCRPSDLAFLLAEETLKMSQEQGGKEGETFSPALFLEGLLFQALQERASDIHFFPRPSFTEILFRKDGSLASFQMIPSFQWDILGGYLKLQSGMNIAESRHPQSGRFSWGFGGQSVECRVSSHPTKGGESFVLRLLDSRLSLLRLEELGCAPFLQALMEKALKKPAGLLIVAGPTGAGKTTTLYAMVKKLCRSSVNIMTLEDPIEYVLPTIRQSQVGDTGILSFPEGVRSLLRQDPDILLVGEIRDSETAHMALRAAMTGHLVLTTIHSLNVMGVIHRLKDLGLSLPSLAGHITAIFAQRLLRRLCLHCRYPLSPEKEKGGNKDPLWEALGCQACAYTGYKGRLALGEGLLMTASLEAQLAAGKPWESATLEKTKGVFLWQEGARYHLREGETSWEEVGRYIDIENLRKEFSPHEFQEESL